MEPFAFVRRCVSSAFAPFGRLGSRRRCRDAPCVPLFNFTVNFAFQPYVRGVDMSPIGLSGIPMHKLWLDRPVPTEAVHAGF